MKKVFTLVVTILALNISTAQITLTEAVDFTVTDLHGVEHNLFDILDNGQYVMVDLFAYWCGPCCSTAPKIKQTYEDFGCNTGDLFVIGLEADGTTQQTEDFENSCGSAGGYPVASGLDGGASEAVDLYMPSAFPTIILIAPDRSIVEQDIWPYTTGDVATLLNGYGIEELDCAPVSVEDLTQINSVQLTPNPTHDNITVNVDLTEAVDLTIEVYNITGQLVLTEQVDQLNAGSHNVDLSLENQATGTYMVKVSVNGELAETVKVNKI